MLYTASIIGVSYIISAATTTATRDTEVYLPNVVHQRHEKTSKRGGICAYPYPKYETLSRLVGRHHNVAGYVHKGSHPLTKHNVRAMQKVDLHVFRHTPTIVRFSFKLSLKSRRHRLYAKRVAHPIKTTHVTEVQVLKAVAHPMLETLQAPRTHIIPKTKITPQLPPRRRNGITSAPRH